MNETVVNDLPIGENKSKSLIPSVSYSQWGFIGYCLLIAALTAGWLLRNDELVTPNFGVGYWLGIIGGTLMLLLVFYPAGKKSKLLRRLGISKHWFRIHMLFGLIGPLLILYHCNFRVTAINSKVALYCMLAVAISGIVGRYIYARIHRGLYGKRTTIEELRNEVAESMENSRGLAAILPNVVKELHTISAEVLGDKYTRSMGVRRSIIWTFKHHYVRAMLRFKINRELRARAAVSETIRGNAGELRVAANHYVRSQVRLMRRVAQLSFYERLFSLWHLFHMPLFILLVISASVHVLAVHMF